MALKSNSRSPVMLGAHQSDFGIWSQQPTGDLQVTGQVAVPRDPHRRIAGRTTISYNCVNMEIESPIPSGGSLKISQIR
jgi:hypothetical protein